MIEWQQSRIRLLLEPFPFTMMIGFGIVLVLLARGLDIAPLHTDVIIHYAWFDEFGVGEFPQRYFDVNQRHPLVGSLVAGAYRLFGQNALPYNVIFQASRIIEGVFMAGIVHRLTRRRLWAICVGLVVMLTPQRLAELYQTINWYIELTLPLLLASTYCYLLSLKHTASRRWVPYGLAVVCYGVSILVYESGLPWIAVTALAAWYLLDTLPPGPRAKRIVLDMIPMAVLALMLVYALFFVFEPWNALTPEKNSASPSKLIQQIWHGFSFLPVYVERLRISRIDGYLGWVMLAGLVSGIGMAIYAFATRITSENNDDTRFWRDTVRLILLGAVIIVSSTLIVMGNKQLGPVYIGRMTFARVTGIALIAVSLIFSAFHLLPVRWRNQLAAVAIAIILIGPGFVWLLMYQDYAHRTRQEIDRITAAAMEARKVMVSPVHMVVITPPEWVGSRFPNAVDVVIHEVQQNLWTQGGDATIDIVKKGNDSLVTEWETKPGTCDTLYGEAQAGICLDHTTLHSSRWAEGGNVPYDDVVVLRYDDESGTMTILNEIDVSTLEDYNVTTAGPTLLHTNPARVVVPLE